MHAGFFDMFHDSADDEIAIGVADGIDVDLGGIFKEAVNKHRAFGGKSAFFAKTSERCELRHCNPKSLVVVNDFHRPAAKHVAGTNENRVTDARGNRQSRVDIGGRATCRLGNLETCTQCIPEFAIFRRID